MGRIKLVMLFLFLIIMTSCKVKGTHYSNDEKFSMSKSKIYHRGLEIGYLDAIKLEKEGNKVKEEYSFILYNNPTNLELAPKLIDYLVGYSSRFKKTDVEVKFLYK